MAQPICLSPLRFYDSLDKQSHRRSYAYNHIYPLIVQLHTLPSFQFTVPSGDNYLAYALLIDANTNEVVHNLLTELYEGQFTITNYDGIHVASFNGHMAIQFNTEGNYYIRLGHANVWDYYSEVFSLTSSIDNCIELEYWNETGDFYLKNGLISFNNNFRFKLLLQTEIGKPEYNFEEESTKRLGYTFVESQVSKKIYKFNAIAPEYLCDAMRLIRLCDNKIIRSPLETFEAISFEMSVDWQTQGDLASVDCEFETDTVIVNTGGPNLIHDKGDYNNDYNNDFDNL